MTPQAKFTKDELTKFCEVLDVATVEASGEIGEHWWPNRGQLGPIPPQDPVIYRLYEVRCTILKLLSSDIISNLYAGCSCLRTRHQSEYL